MNNNFDCLQKIVLQVKSLLDSQAFHTIQEYLNNNEYEMALEGLIIELIKLPQIPNDINLKELENLFLSFEIAKDPIFDIKIEEKFKKWLDSRNLIKKIPKQQNIKTSLKAAAGENGETIQLITLEESDFEIATKK